MGLLFLFVLLLLDGKATYREIIGALLVASSPSIIDRVQRLIAFFFRITEHPMDNFFSLSHLVFVNNSGWLDMWPALQTHGSQRSAPPKLQAGLLCVKAKWR